VYDPNQGQWGGQNPQGNGGNPYDPGNPYGYGYGYDGYGGYEGTGQGAQGFDGQNFGRQGYGAQGGYAGYPQGGHQQGGYHQGGYQHDGFPQGGGMQPGGAGQDPRRFRIRGVDFGQVFDRAWRGFAADPGGWIVFGLALLAVGIVCGVALFAFSSATGVTHDAVSASDFDSVLGGAGEWQTELITLVIAIAIGGPIYNMALQAAMRRASGEHFEVGGYFTFRNLGNFMVVYSVFELFGYALQWAPFVGGILAAFFQVFFFFVVYAAVDGLDLQTSFTRSWQIFSQNVGLCLISGLVFCLLLIAGALMLGLGLFVTGPMYLVAGAVIYIAATRGVAEPTGQPYQPPFPYGPTENQSW